MSLFNARILEAGIQDVVTHLDDAQKADVLLHALQHLSGQGCHRVLENAVESLLQVPNLRFTDVTRALLLRARGRLAEGHRTSARTDPGDHDVEAAVESQRSPTEMSIEESSPHIPEEVWQHIALFLPRRDLRSLPFVPGALSRTARQLLFSEIEIHLTTSIENETSPEEISDDSVRAWHNGRSAAILARILVDPRFAAQVRKLSIYAVPSRNTLFLEFHVGILANALSKLSNLYKVHCSGKQSLISGILRAVHSYNPRLQQLSIVVIGRADLEVPPFKHLTHFAMTSKNGNVRSIDGCLAESANTLRHLSTNDPHWVFLAEVISVQHLTQVEFSGCLSTDAFSNILSDGHQLESLLLSGELKCTPSSLFRQHHTALPSLRHFSLTVTSLPNNIEDRDFCPAISDFLRERTRLRTCRLILSIPSTAASRIGYDASAWGVLQSLTMLSTLSITYPKGLPAVLAGWLVPRTVRALELDLSSATDDVNSPDFIHQLYAGMPPQLRYISVLTAPSVDIRNAITREFSNVRVVRVNRTTRTVTRSGEGESSVTQEEWSPRRAKYYAAESLESLGCADAIWEGVDGPSYM